MTEASNDIAAIEDELSAAQGELFALIDDLAAVRQQYDDEAMEAADLRSELREAREMIDVLEDALDDIQIVVRRHI